MDTYKKAEEKNLEKFGNQNWRKRDGHSFSKSRYTLV